MIQDVKIKGLKSQLKKMIGESQSMKIELSNFQKIYQEKLNKIKDFEKMILDHEKDNTVRVTEHAIIRYLERIEGLDIECVKDKILTSNVSLLIETLGNNDGKYPNGSFQVVLKNNAITTIIKN